MATRTIANAGGNWGTAGTWVEGVAPTAADDVVATGTSGNVTIDGTSGSPSLCRSADFTNYVGILTQASAKVLTIGDASGGTLKLAATMTYAPNAGSTINLVSTTTGNTVTCAGFTLGIVNFNGAGGGWTLQDTFRAAGLVTHSKGTLDTNGQTLTLSGAGGFSTSGSSVRTLTLGASQITISATTFPAWNAGTTTNLTFNANSSTIFITGSGTSFSGGGLTYNNVQMTGGGQQTLTGNSTISGTLTIQPNAGNCTISGSNTIGTLTFVATSAKTNQISLGGDQTINTALNLSGGSVVNRIFLASNTRGTPRTVTCNGTNTIANADFMDIIGAGTASWALGASSSGDCGGNSGITFTTPQTNFYQTAVSDNFSTTGKWFLGTNGTGGAGRIPLPQDTARFDANSVTAAAKTITQDMPRMGAIDFTGVANTPALSTTASWNLFGSLTLVSGMTHSGTGSLTLSGRSSFTFDGGGLTWPASSTITMNGPGGTYTNQSNLTSSSTLTVTAGTFAAGTKNLSFTAININGGTLDMGSNNTLTVSGTGTVWNYTSGTISGGTGTSTLIVSDTSVSTKAMVMGANTYNSLTVNGAASNGTVTFSGAFTASGTVTFQPDASIVFTKTTTYTLGALAWTGTSGHTISVQTDTGGSAATISCAAAVSCDYLVLKDSTASGNTPFYAGANSTNVSGNTNWTFTAPPAAATGSMTSTCAADTMSATAALTFTGSMSASDAADTMSGSGAFSITATGVMVATAANDTMSGSAAFAAPRSTNVTAASGRRHEQPMAKKRQRAKPEEIDWHAIEEKRSAELRALVEEMFIPKPVIVKTTEKARNTESLAPHFASIAEEEDTHELEYLLLMAA